MELGILTLGDLQRNPTRRSPTSSGWMSSRSASTTAASSSPHRRTTAIRLTSATTLLGVADPVRVYEDFATVDLISRGRAEIIVGRSAFVGPFRLFGYDTADYDALFAEKLGLLLDIRSSEKVTWSGRFRPGLDGALVTPRAAQDPLPVWVGVGGSPESAERAGRLGLPMILGYCGRRSPPGRGDRAVGPETARLRLPISVAAPRRTAEILVRKELIPDADSHLGSDSQHR
jgi:alkanesulfonate monooxygenase SsuD/methylene tetrahydromethanopterin reductase-like flavin-dependent oxidoreductase (luciferase family)